MEGAIIGLIGVIVGGAIGIIGQVFLSRFDYKKWQKEKAIELLKNEKENLENKFQQYKQKLQDGMKSNSYDVEMCFDFMYTFPKNVSETFDKMMEDKNKDNKSMRNHYHLIIGAMKESLADIDDKIKKEIYKK